MLVRAAQAELLEGDPHGSITLLADTETVTSNRSY